MTTTIYLEFLSRAQFESFEDAAERIWQWVKYYDHKRPHQGIGGLCPADRYFEIQGEKAHTELNTGLAAKLAHKPRCPREHLDAYASSVEHDLNHRPRPCLNGGTACQVYLSGRRTFTRWERRDSYDGC